MCALHYVSLPVRSDTLLAMAQVKSGRPSEKVLPSHHCIAYSILNAPFELVKSKKNRTYPASTATGAFAGFRRQVKGSLT